MRSYRTARLSIGSSIVLVLALTLFGASPALARGYLLDPITWYVATTGADTNSCNAFDAPCLTINGAIAKAAAGDAVKVAIGIYGGTGTQVVLVDKDITLLGGWDAAFAAQTGLSTVDGEDARTGVTINEGVTVVMDRFAIRYGVADAFGGGIYSLGILTVSDSLISDNSAGWMGGGIYSDGTLTVNDTTIRNNTAGDPCCSGGGGGGGIFSAGAATLNNTTVSGNRIVGAFEGSGITNFAISFVVNNSTISGNTGVEGIYSLHGSMILNNSTVTRNSGGIKTEFGTVTLRNSIIAGNLNYDCSGSITSSGYNLIGRNTGCYMTAKTGDKVGTGASPINPRLLPLAKNGGPTPTHALAGDSPALNAGSPLTPGSDARACLPADQRGVARAVDGICDMGAFEGYFTAVTSVVLLDPNPTSASSVRFSVKFSEAVTGVDVTAPFSDFSLTQVGITGTSLTSVSGTGDTYTVTVNTGKNNGSLRLNVVDNDTILDGSSNPLGGPGAGNGNYTTGQTYTIKKIPTAVSPANISIWDQTPTYKWSKIPGAISYSYQLFKGTTLVYSKIFLASTCGATACVDTPSNILPFGAYKWRVRAMTQGTWKPFSPFKSFTILGAKAGLWKGNAVDFYVSTNRSSVDDYSIFISVTGCGNYKITHTDLVPIVNGKFKFTGAFYASGTFSSATSVSGQLGLYRYPISGCGLVTGGPYSWSAVWRSFGQPDPLTGAQVGRSFLLLPDLDAPFPGTFSIDPLP